MQIGWQLRQFPINFFKVGIKNNQHKAIAVINTGRQRPTLGIVPLAGLKLFAGFDVPSDVFVSALVYRFAGKKLVAIKYSELFAQTNNMTDKRGEMFIQVRALS